MKKETQIISQKQHILNQSSKYRIIQKNSKNFEQCLLFNILK